jgi:hypothetical protein
VRLALLGLALTGFAGLGLYDLAHGHVTVGVAGLLLVCVNGLLFTQ